MKKMIKPLLLAATAIMLVVATVFATMAYMTSSSAVSNVFTVGNVNLQMFETKVNSEGKPVDASGNVIAYDPNAVKTADTNSYHLQPGMSYLKDPTVYVGADSDKSYLFIRVRNDLKTIEKQGDPTAPTMLEQLTANGWLEIERAASNVDAVFVYVGKDAMTAYNAKVEEINADTTKSETEKTTALAEERKNLKAMLVGGTGESEVIDVFGKFTLATEIPNLSAFGGARVAIVAYAIQSNGITTEDKVGTEEGYRAAWEYIKAELPFVV